MACKTFFLALIAFLLISCSNDNSSVKKNDTVYYIIKYYSPKPTPDTSDILPPPLPPRMFYGVHNFILVDTSKIFYHDEAPLPPACIPTGIDYSKPERLRLTPDSLIEINVNNLNHFLNTTITDSMFNGRYVSASIASSIDTIKNPAFKIIRDHFMKKKIKRYVIRNWTEEEMYVTKAKINNQKYEPDSIEWKVGFGGIIFLPPVEEEKYK